MPVDVSRLVPYRVAVFDNARWARYEPRPDDIFICTPSKSGTTWMQTIVANLLFPDGDLPGPIMQISPWIEAEFIPLDAMYGLLQSQTHRRFIKSHTPADGIPVFADAKYIHVVRDGRDAFMSWCNHVRAMRAELKAGLSARALAEGVEPFPDWDGEDVHAFFRSWLEGASHFNHVASFWPHRNSPNFLFVHYRDLKADLEREMRRAARFLDITLSEASWPGVVQRCTFEAMRTHGDRLGPLEQNFVGGVQSFLFKGVNGRWRDVLDADDLAAYERRVKESLDRDAAAWLEHGRARLGPVPNP